MLAVAPALAQDGDNDRLRGLTKAAPALPVERLDLKVNPPLTLEGISAVAGDEKGNIYVIHRPAATGDPIVVVDRQGTFVRSWGKGLFKTPHGIRVDPAGNVWTVDAGSSMVYKFTPQGQKLLEISVGDIPDPSRPFCGATDVAFANNGHVYVSPTVTAMDASSIVRGRRVDAGRFFCRRSPHREVEIGVGKRLVRQREVPPFLVVRLEPAAGHGVDEQGPIFLRPSALTLRSDVQDFGSEKS